VATGDIDDHTSDTLVGAGRCDGDNGHASNGVAAHYDTGNGGPVAGGRGFVVMAGVHGCVMAPTRT
jgi:hypothetical protein